MTREESKRLGPQALIDDVIAVVKLGVTIALTVTSILAAALLPLTWLLLAISLGCATAGLLALYRYATEVKSPARTATLKALDALDPPITRKD